jgi:ubiquinone/menaquinone biosynthesis C-methylase UbiE
MSIGRRKVALEDSDSWIFNRMVEAYGSRPAYPDDLIEKLAQLAGPPPAKVADIGAGIGHLALPLAQRGFEVTAVEPAESMLARLEERARQEGAKLHPVHGVAEQLTLPTAHFDLVLVADALHFLDAERSALELSRILAPRGAMALVTCAFTPTPFMLAVEEIMQDAAPRRPRDVRAMRQQILAVAEVRTEEPVDIVDETPVNSACLEGILRSISFIGPAMNQARYAAFRQRIHQIPHEPIWARTFTLQVGRR